MKTGIFLVGLVFLFTSSAFSQSEASNKEILSTINSYAPGIITEATINPDNPVGLFGQYSDAVFLRFSGGLGGDELYLFPDKTFYLLLWTDVIPKKIYDMGTWNLQDGRLELKSDASITWKQIKMTIKQRKYLPMYYFKDNKRILLLMDIEWNFPNFNKQVRDKEFTDYEFTLFLQTLSKKQEIGLSDYKNLKEKLFKEYWHPESFTKTTSPATR